MEVRESFPERVTLKQNPGGEGESHVSKWGECSWQKELQVQRPSRGVLSSWNTGLMMSIVSVFLVSVLINSHPQSPLWLYFIGPIGDTTTERSFSWLPHWVPRAPKKLNCSLSLSPLILVLLTKSHLLMLDTMDKNDTSSTLFHNYCVLHIKDADKVPRGFRRGMTSAGTTTARPFTLSSDSLHSE